MIEKIKTIIQNQNSRKYDTFVEQVDEHEYNNALEIWEHAQKDMYDKITQLLMDKGIIYRNGYGCLNSDLKSENLGERLVAFAKEMDKLKTKEEE